MFVQISNFHYTQVLLLTQQQKKHIFDKKTTGDVFKITKDHVFYKKEEKHKHTRKILNVLLPYLKQFQRYPELFTWFKGNNSINTIYK